MDFIAWCDHVLHTVIEVQGASALDRQHGVREEQIAQMLYGDTFPYQPGFWESSQRIGMWNALGALEQVHLIVSGQNSVLMSATPAGMRHLEDPIPLWERLCSERLYSDQGALLCAVNQLCVREEVDYVWLADVNNVTLLNALSESEAA